MAPTVFRPTRVVPQCPFMHEMSPHLACKMHRDLCSKVLDEPDPKAVLVGMVAEATRHPAGKEQDGAGSAEVWHWHWQ